MASRTFVIDGSLSEIQPMIAKRLVRGGLSVYTAFGKAEGGILARKGSAARTALFGAFAGNRFEIELTIDFSTDAEGHLVACLADSRVPALRGGVVGWHESRALLDRVARVVETDLSAAKVLVGSH